MGQTLTDAFGACCTTQNEDRYEIDNGLITNGSLKEGEAKSSTPTSLAVNSGVNKQPSTSTMNNLEFGAASDFTKNSSSAQTGAKVETKKVLQFRLFKSLKNTTDISAKYSVGRVLGKGSFGEVRECLNNQTGVTCAMKIVNKAHIGKHQVLIDLMEQELDVLQKTDHPHIVRVLELLQDEVNFYIITELVTGGELYDYIIKVKRLGERAAAGLIKQLLLALNYMHQQDIAHRDIKPENILLAPEEADEPGKLNLKLTDFGFAVFYQPQSGLKQVLGSPLYMAPEIVRQQPYDKSVDVWAVGVIAHILLSGSPPFFGKTKPDIQKSIIGDIPKFGRVKAQLTPEAIQFVMKCLSKDPERRFTTEEALSHQWLSDNCDEPEIDLDAANEMVEDMAAFRKQNVFQTGVVSLLSALKVQSSELINMKKMFLRLDSSQDGFLSFEELSEGMNQVLGTMRAGTQDWHDLVHQLDTNQDNKIDYGEFITAAINRARLLNSENLRIAFSIFDKDGNGVISKEELRAVFHGGLCQVALEEGDDQLWSQIMSEVDRNHDNVISYSEFNEAMVEVIAHRSSSLGP